MSDAEPTSTKSESGMLSSLRTRLRESLDAIPARQRALLFGLLGTVLFLGTAIAIYSVYDTIDTLEEKNDAMGRALRDIEQKREAYLSAKARERNLESRIGGSSLQLSGFLEQMAKEVGIEIRETNPRSPEPVGKKYLQQSIDVRIGKVALEPLLKFMRKIETYPSNLVLVTELSIRSRDDKHQDFEVDLTISTYEHAPKTAKKGTGGKGGEGEKDADKN
ncbi:MAG TPA: hypothetical protein PKI03_26015 [Pseudomonadota bacterium]|nr:hypothetical protein [Pseudomonadota bacterium]